MKRDRTDYFSPVKPWYAADPDSEDEGGDSGSDGGDAGTTAAAEAQRRAEEVASQAAAAADLKDGGETTNAGCFLTTATVHALGMPDDCEPLELARFLRDEKMTSGSDRAAVDLYYKVGPAIVARSTDAEWVEFWRRDMRKITTLIKTGEHDLAKGLYTLATARLVNQKATRFSDTELVEEVYDFGLKGFAKWLPYPMRFALLKAAFFVGLKYKGLRLWLAQRRFAHLLDV